MPVVKNTFEENYLFFLRELSRINRELNNLPKGSISIKKIGGIAYYYHQWREGKKVKSVSIGREAPPDLIRKINRRKTLEAQKRGIPGTRYLIPGRLRSCLVRARTISKPSAKKQRQGGQDEIRGMGCPSLYPFPYYGISA